jgi:hypothetical protein
MIIFYLQANQALNYSSIIYNRQLIHISFRLFQLLFPIKSPSIFFCNRATFFNHKRQYTCRETITGYNIFYRISEFVYFKIQMNWGSLFHLANLRKNARLFNKNGKLCPETDRVKS